MTAGVEILDLAVVGPLVRDVESSWDGTSIGVVSALLKQVGVETLVQVVDGVVEGQQHDLRDLLGQVVSYFFFEVGVDSWWL